MYPDTTGGAFGRDAFGRGDPPPPSQPIAGAAWIPAQRRPWEPPPRQPGEPRPAVPGPVPPERPSGPPPVGAGSSPVEAGSRPVEAGGGPAEAAPVLTPAPEGAADGAEVIDGSRAAEAADGARGTDIGGPDAAETGRPDGAESVVTADPDAPKSGPAPAEAAEPGHAVDAAPAETAQSDPAEAAEAATPSPSPARSSARPLRPGDVPETPIVLWGEASAEAEAFRQRIREAGNLFVDDPNFAVTATAAVVTEAVNALAAALERQHAELDPRRSCDNPDTEALRVAVRRYRELLSRVLAL